MGHPWWRPLWPRMLRPLGDCGNKQTNRQTNKQTNKNRWTAPLRKAPFLRRWLKSDEPYRRVGLEGVIHLFRPNWQADVLEDDDHISMICHRWDPLIDAQSTV